MNPLPAAELLRKKWWNGIEQMCRARKNKSAKRRTHKRSAGSMGVGGDHVSLFLFQERIAFEPSP